MRLLEEGEVHATVLALFHEAGMIGEIVVLAMLQYQEAIFAQEVSFQNHVGQFGYFLQDVWGVGKDKVELFSALAQELEHVTLDGACREVLQLVYKFLDESEVQGVFLHAYHPRTASGEEFQCNATCSGKEVESKWLFIPIYIGVEHVE